VISRRSALLAVAGLLLVAIVITAWQAWQVRQDLVAAEYGVDRLSAAVEAGDTAARDAAVEDLQEASASASDRTDGLWWSALSKLPVVGDDVSGVRALSSSLDLMARDGIAPLATTIDDLDRLSADGTIDVSVVEGLEEPVAQAGAAFEKAADEVDDIDSSGFVGALRPRFDDYVDRVDEAASALAAADTATQILPTMVGADGPRDYLLIFQNNAEIRATGGMPGAWAQIHAEDGNLKMVKQGTAADFPMAQDPVLPLTDEEIAVYGEEIGTYFQDPGFTPDFPRAAALWRAHWDTKFPSRPIDGVLSLDPVAMSYLLEGTGPVSVGPRTLTSDNLVDELLNKPYRELGVREQDALFEDVAGAIFKELTGDLPSPVDMVRGMNRAAGERRFLIASFDPEIASRLEATAVEGKLSGDDGTTPHVDIGVNDATGSKMSYYLRYWADVKATSCSAKGQQLEGTMSLSQSIAPAHAAALPDSVTGGGLYGTEPGTQLVFVRLYGPHEGAIDEIRIDGKKTPFEQLTLAGRPVSTLAISVATRDDVVVTWSMSSAPKQTGAGVVDLTPGVQSGNLASSFGSSC
jgi:hypothetical protein